MAGEPTRSRPKRMTANALKQKAQTMSALALQTLAAIMEGTGQDSVKLAAAREVLDRAHGKPKAAAKAKAPKPSPKGPKSVRVIIKRFSDVTPEEEAAADATERDRW